MIWANRSFQQPRCYSWMANLLLAASTTKMLTCIIPLLSPSSKLNERPTATVSVALLSGCEERPATRRLALPRIAVATTDSQSVSAPKGSISDLPSDYPPNKKSQTLSGVRKDHFGWDAEELPVFIGGNDSLRAFLNRHVQWPDSLPQSVSGKVFVRFTIDERGEIRNAHIVQSLHTLADAEALRLAGLLSGHFTPDRHDGRAVSSETILPLTFIGTDAAPMKQSK
ncbi:hypothetical protein CDA63_04905 [Hymenobacter amundsenii]|uniref:TonB C-terminal domain-containing protein n=1 Tax=Hymenobacter amundsenii TaxID=2006685 RepID=A0A246FNN1_9BACT|nr:hypothetical protein CDA63_04905 [Hymenobacter amundsenii]